MKNYDAKDAWLVIDGKKFSASAMINTTSAMINTTLRTTAKKTKTGFEITSSMRKVSQYRPSELSSFIISNTYQSHTKTSLAKESGLNNG